MFNTFLHYIIKLAVYCLRYKTFFFVVFVLVAEICIIYLFFYLSEGWVVPPIQIFKYLFLEASFELSRLSIRFYNFCSDILETLYTLWVFFTLLIDLIYRICRAIYLFIGMLIDLSVIWVLKLYKSYPVWIISLNSYLEEFLINSYKIMDNLLYKLFYIFVYQFYFIHWVKNYILSIIRVFSSLDMRVFFIVVIVVLLFYLFFFYSFCKIKKYIALKSAISGVNLVFQKVSFNFLVIFYLMLIVYCSYWIFTIVFGSHIITQIIFFVILLILLVFLYQKILFKNI